jgi:predicted MPP superfamily phosphohydrolase
MDEAQPRGGPALFQLIFLGVFFSLYAYIGARFIGPAPVSEGTALALWGLVAFVAALFPLAVRLRFGRGDKGPFADTLIRVVYVLMGVTALLFTMTFARDVLWLGGHLTGLLPDGELARQTLLHQTNLGILGLTAAGTLIGRVEARRTPRIKRVDVPIEGLPEALHGFSIAQITDLHIGPNIGRDFVENVVDAINALDADAIALTGDIIDGPVEELAHDAAPLGELRARHGAFYVTGNHEYYSGALPWLHHFESLGMATLVNEHRVIDHDGAQLVMAGVADYSAGAFYDEHRSSPARALEGAPDESVRVLLAHQPRSVKQAEAAGGFHLQLSGHTHGGQIFPWNFVVPVQQPTVAGLKRFGEMWLYTSRGTGFWGPPMRIGAPSEISLLRLVPA